MGMYDNCPCRECVAPKRHPGCHGSCPDKAEWDKTFGEAKAAIRQEVRRGQIVGGFIAGNSRRVDKFLYKTRNK
ncbi:MAG: hypothetical protein J6S50_04865 [Oscillospiraceae bacterium]|nr:hypothetical protein [Oscillospiraceae bacterium]